MTELANTRYSLSQFNDIIFDGGVEYKLSSNITNILRTLSELLPDTDITTTSSDNYQYRKESEYTPTKPRDIPTKYVSKNRTTPLQSKNAKPINNSASSDWTTLRNYKTTQVDIKHGVDKTFNEIRITLNKLSNKTYDQPRDRILELLKEIMDPSTMDDDKSSAREDDVDSDNQKHNIQFIAKSVFDIASTNKFYSEIYATLYKDLVSNYDVFRDMLDGFVQIYIDEFSKIHYVDADDNYDLFCEYTKKCDQQKATSTFIVNLLKKRVLTPSKTGDTIRQIYAFYMDFIAAAGRENEAEEIAECMSILITRGVTELTANRGTDIMPICLALASMKTVDFPSLTNRAVFKFKDIWDNVNITQIII